MKVLCVCPMREEAQALIEVLEHDFFNLPQAKFHATEYHGLKDTCNAVFTFENSDVEKVVVAQVGIGKVASAVNTIREWIYGDTEGDKATVVLVVGICAGGRGTTLKKTYVIQEGIQYDFDLEKLGLAVGQLPAESDYIKPGSRYTDTVGQTAIAMSADCFATENQHEFVLNKCSGVLSGYTDSYPIIFDMETAAIFQACSLVGIPSAAVRAVSDKIGDARQAEKYQENKVEACRNAAEVASRIISKWIKEG